MIQLSALSAAGTENPGKTVGLAMLKGEFERLLSGEGPEGGLPGGKILPEAGTTLPDGLPTVELVPLAGRKLIGDLVKKPGMGTRSDAAEAEFAEDADLAAQPEAPLEPSVPALSAGAADLPAAVSAMPAEVRASPSSDKAEALPANALGGSRKSSDLPLPADGHPANARKVGRKSTAEAAEATHPPLVPTVQALAKLPIAPVLDPSMSNGGKRPADAPQPARIAPGNASDPIVEIKLQLATATQQDAAAGHSAERRAAASLTNLQTASGAQSPQPIAAETAPILAEASAGRDVASAAPSQAQTTRPHDLTLLVDRLVEARDNARSANASLSVMHADFGRVSMHFAHDNGNLTVSLTNNDPGFARAVNATVAADTGLSNESQPQADRRGDGGHGASTRTSAGEHGSHGERGSQSRGERHDRNASTANHSHRETAGARSGSRGIFA